jgi:pimeloyl-ACP methyl ester carboxylesterase
MANALSEECRVVGTDWPGFGEGRHSRLDYTPALLSDFLETFVEATFGGDVPAVVAAGHAAGYALALAQRRPGVWRRVVLITPTWRGPLPTMMGGYRPLQR